MGFLLMGTVIWLAWVLALQTSADALIYLLLCLLIAGFAAWIFGRWSNPVKSRKTRTVSALIAISLLISSFLFAGNSINDEIGVSRGNYSNSVWENYSSEKIDRLKAENKPYFIDFTAAWCLSCQVNKKVALNNEEVLQRFEDLDFTLIKADWTSRDENITKALAEFGRNSVPLYVLYDGISDNPEILPEILTPDIVLNALNKLN
jgi:thiol:disulfide interchange protein DsbD